MVICIVYYIAIVANYYFSYIYFSCLVKLHVFILENYALSFSFIYWLYANFIITTLLSLDGAPLLRTDVDSRMCSFCGQLGEHSSDSRGRLLYVGRDLWAHTLCSLWSAEVYESYNGTLQNVYAAIRRGKTLVCNFKWNIFFILILIL